MKKILLALSVLLSLTACSNDEAAAPEIGITTPEGGYTIDKMQWLRIQPEIKNANEATFSWSLDGKEIATTANLQYAFAEAGTHNIQLKVKNEGGEIAKTFAVTVNEKTYINKITRVFDFLPAPGQFTNDLPKATIDDTSESMRIKAETNLMDNKFVSLGGFGGFVTFGFDHTIINKEGNDFIVLGNAYVNNAEPGIIMVSYDANGNGKADDEWYEIAGSEFNKETTMKNYEITYYKPQIEPAPRSNEPNYIKWTDNQGASGYISKNQYHDQSFYPLWKGATVTFKGTLLKSNMEKKGFWVTPAYEWGYADNWANTDVKAQINMDWAVDKDGKAVKLQGIDFVKVYNSNRAENSSTGEVSTEVSGFTDLNLVK
ncbi:MAG: PKD-like domain-containing protein [Flavobacterium sp.]